MAMLDYGVSVDKLEIAWVLYCFRMVYICLHIILAVRIKAVLTRLSVSIARLTYA